MRAIFPAAALVIAVFSLYIELFPRSPASTVCRMGACRYDQIFTQVDAAGGDRRSLEALLLEDPANPGIWCAYGELLASTGEEAKAAQAFDQALAFGPGMAPVLMRAANFDFTHNRLEQALVLVPRILQQTEVFDQVLFSYLDRSQISVERLEGHVVPTTQRAARSWLAWLEAHGSSDALGKLWSWMKANELADERSAEQLSRILWERKDYTGARDVWWNWSGAHERAQLLGNSRFGTEPRAIPFDWDLTPKASVAYQRQNGLDIRFLGQDNIDFAGMDQFTPITPGRYHFSADVSAENLTTDQGPFFRIEDVDSPGRLTVETKPILGSAPGTQIGEEFTVQPGSRALRIRLVRRPSLKFDNKITGTLHIWQVSLTALRT